MPFTLAGLLALLVATLLAAQAGWLTGQPGDGRGSAEGARAARAPASSDQRDVPALTRALGAGEYGIRASAAEALVKLGPGPVVPSMIEALRHSDVRVRANAAGVLGSFGPAAKPAAAALAGALRDENPRVRELAAEALTRIASAGPGPQAVLPLNCH
jgi:HEAT repeat protein